VAADNPRRSFSEFAETPLRIKPEPAPAPDYDESEPDDKAAILDRIPVERVDVVPSSRLVMITDPRSPGADRVRFLRMRLHEIRRRAKLKSIVITSPLPDDGKSTIALNLATALAEGGKRSVLLVEADLHQPALAKVLEVAARPGLAECIEESADPLLSLWHLDPLHVYILQAGLARGNPTELLQSVALPKLLERLSPYFEWILVDTPPVAPLTDALTISRVVDGTLLVVRAERTPKDVVEEAVEQIGTRHLIGIVLNAASGLNKVYSKYTKYYGRKK
jgi:capsular exopolysaccharide synthesis family protein